jgi:hypothetical protein
LRGHAATLLQLPADESTSRLEQSLTQLNTLKQQAVDTCAW